MENIEEHISIEAEEKEINSPKKYLAIDVGGTAIKYTIIDENAKIFGINEINTKRQKEEELWESFDKIILPHLNQIEGIALSFPGPVNVKEGIAHTGGAFGWIYELPLKSILEKRYSKRVWIENDGKCCTLAELWKGNLSDIKNGVTIILGTGIAGGIILNGELYRGTNGSAAEFSSVLDKLENPNTARRFCDVGGYNGLINQYVKAKGEDSSNITGREFFEQYNNGDEKALNAIKDYANVIATAIINFQSILDVEKFCIGGGISSQEILISEIKERVHDYFMNKATRAINEPEIERCLFENAAGCVGALYNFLINEKHISQV